MAGHDELVDLYIRWGGALIHDSQMHLQELEETQEFPKKPKKTKKTKKPKLTLRMVQSTFHMPMETASETLGISHRQLRDVCRLHGIERWPKRKLDCLDTMATVLTNMVEQVAVSANRDAIMADPNTAIDPYLFRMYTCGKKSLHRQKMKG
ncbi:Protein NLP6 [Tetrabaena socialis]|uniref:Protein NLP6 n=1 Tax=Tetrabaena socialis TaxID=47790 RepID=A0A2J8AJ86_9CHLO|nr:Protein NLP6 [Tetrabaena socialis]|eukprot:PNH12571.1 Protein NLP6 [Tetrabaena socialis]